MDTPSRCPRQSESQGLEEDLPLGQGLLLQTGQVGGLEGLRDETRLEGAVEVPPEPRLLQDPLQGPGLRAICHECCGGRVKRGRWSAHRRGKDGDVFASGAFLSLASLFLLTKVHLLFREGPLLCLGGWTRMIFFPYFL